MGGYSGNTVLALAKERFLGESSEEWGWSNRAKGWKEERTGPLLAIVAPPLIFVACSIPFLGYYFYTGRKRGGSTWNLNTDRGQLINLLSVINAREFLSGGRLFFKELKTAPYLASNWKYRFGFRMGDLSSLCNFVVWLIFDEKRTNGRV